METIKVGDSVWHRGYWGLEEPKLTKIVSMELCKEPNLKQGTGVSSAGYADKDCLVVVLGNGKWAFGWQIEVLGKRYTALTN